MEMAVTLVKTLAEALSQSGTDSESSHVCLERLFYAVILTICFAFENSTYLQRCAPGSEDKGQHDRRHVFTCG